MKLSLLSRHLHFACLALLLLSGCSRERGDLSKHELPEYFGVFAAVLGNRPEQLSASEQDAGPDLDESIVFVVHLQGLSLGGNPSAHILLLDRARVRHEVEQVKFQREGPVVHTRIHPPRDLFASFQKLPIRFRPAPQPDMLVVVPDEPLKPGLYVLRVGQEEYPFSVGLGNTPLAENPLVRATDHYFVTLDAKKGSSIEALLALSQRGLPVGNVRNSIGDNPILEDFYRETASIDGEMAAQRSSAIAAMQSRDFEAAIEATIRASSFYPNDAALLKILQDAPKAAVEAAIAQKQWSMANGWIDRGRAIAPDKEKFEVFAGKTAYECAMSEAQEQFAAQDFQNAATSFQRALTIAPTERGRKEAEDFVLKSKIEQHLAEARRARDTGDTDAQLEAALSVIKLDKGSKDARHLASEARERIIGDPSYFGKFFRIAHRIELDADRLGMIAFSQDGKRLHAYFDTQPQQFVAWDAETGTEVERREMQSISNAKISTDMLASMVVPVGMDPSELNRANSTARGYHAKKERIGNYETQLQEAVENLKKLQSTGGTPRDIQREEQRIEGLRKRLDGMGPLGLPPSSIGFRILRSLGAADDCSLALGLEYARYKSFLSRSDRLMALAPNTNDGRLLLVDPSQAAILREVRMPFTPEDGQSPSSGKMGINDVAFSSDLSILAAANGHGVAIFRVRDGEVLYSSKTKEDVTRLLGVSNDGKQIAFSATSSYMPVTNWKTWNLSEGTDPEDAQGSLDEWKLTPDLRIGVGGSGSRIQVFAPGKEQPLANFDPPIAREEGGAKIRMGGPQWDLSADGRKLAIADNRAIEIWAVTPPLLPD